MTDKQIKYIARFYSAVLIYNSLGTGASSDLMTEEEHELFAEEVELIAKNLVNKIKNVDDVFKCATLDQIIQFTLERENNKIV